MKKWICLICVLFSLSNATKAEDLTQFDFPFLLGDWYWFSPDQQSELNSDGVYKAINISFKSDYRFNVKLLNRNNTVEDITGSYDLDETTLVLNDDFGQEQHHSYKLNHNQLMLKSAQFTKILPNNLSGAWHSDIIRGKDVDDQVEQLSLMLRPDFLFSARVSGKKGQLVTHRGVYIVEDDHLVLIYGDGQQDSQFKLTTNTLTLVDEQFGMEAILQRKIP